MYPSSLQHYGIKGMRWGVRRYQNEDGTLTEAGKRRYTDTGLRTTTKSGDTMYLYRLNAPKISKKLFGNKVEKSHILEPYVNGRKVGDMNLEDENPQTMNFSWISVKNKYRGLGYSRDMTRLAEEYTKKFGKTRITAELVGHSPQVHRISMDSGYVKVGENVAQDVLDMWGGLTLVEKRLDNTRIPNGVTKWDRTTDGTPIRKY